MTGGRRQGRLLVLGGALVLAWPLAVALAGAGDRLLPGTRLGGRSLAFLDAAVATERIRDIAPPPLLVGGLDAAKPVAVERAAMGLRVDEVAGLNTAQAWSSSRRGRLAALALGFGGVDLPLAYRLDEATARAWLEDLKSRVDRDPSSAFVDLSEGRPLLRPGQDGLRLDVEGSLARLRQSLVDAPDDFEPVVERLAPQALDSASALRSVILRLGAPLTLEAYDPIRDETLRWELPASAWLPAARRVEWGAEGWRWQLRPEGLTALYADLASQLGDRRMEADELGEVLGRRLDGDAAAAVRLRHPPRPVTVQSGETVAAIGRAAGIPFPRILEANPGLGDQLRPGQRILLPSPDDLLPLPPRRDRRILVRLGAQRMQAWQDGNLLWDWPVSTGIDSSPTATGVFQVQDRQKEAFATAWDLWMPYFLSIYQPDSRVQVSNGFHGLPWRKDGSPVWAELIGQPASYGCIVISTENARLLFDWALPGTVVEIRE